MRHRWKLSLPLLALLALGPAISAVPAPMAGASADVQPYGAVHALDFALLLPPPPDAAETRREIGSMLKLQEQRTEAEAEACRADQLISVFRFADVLGPKFTPGALPKTAILFARALATADGPPMDAAKDRWRRLRPPLVDRRMHPCDKLPKSFSYPSGHSTAGNLMATLLADMIPERSAQIHARGRLFAFHRVLGGVHFPSDIDAGRLCAAAAAQALFEDPEFRTDFAAAKAELRAHLGYAALP